MKLISRRQFTLSLVGLVITIAMSGCGWLVDKPISIAAHVWPGYEPMFLARNEGWLNTNQVNLVETTSLTDSMQALVDGKVDGAALTMDEVLKGRSKGLKISVVMIFDVSAGADVLMARAGISKLSDLKGRRIGYEPGSLGALMLAESLRAAGLTKADVRLVTLTSDKQLAAWMHGQIDALITYEPLASKLLAQGAVKLFDSRQMPNTILDVLAIRDEALDHSHAAAIRHLLSAHFKALEHISHNPHDAAYRMADHLSLPEEQVMQVFQGLFLPDVRNNRRMLSGNSPPILEATRHISALMVQEGLLAQEDPLTALIHADFLPSAAQ